MGWKGAIVLILMRLLYVEARYARASVQRGAIVFQATWIFRLLLGGTTFFVTTLLIRDSPGEEWWIIVAGALIVVVCSLMWPSIITITEAAIEQRTWWRRTQRLPWADVTAMQKSSSGEISVFGRHNRRIRFSRYHIDPERFQREVIRRTNIKVIDSSGPLTIR